MKKTQEEVDQVVGWMGDRYYWADVLSDLRQVLIRVGTSHQEQAADGCGRLDRAVGDGRPAVRKAKAIPGLDQVSPRARGPCPRCRRRRRMPSTGDMVWNDAARRRRRPRPRRSQRRAERLPFPQGTKGDTNEIATLTITFRAVSLKECFGSG